MIIGDWKPNLAWGKKRKVRKQLILGPSTGLQSHYQVRGLWKSTTEEWFEQRFAEKESNWLLQDGDVLDLGEQQVLVPNFQFNIATNLSVLAT